MGYVQAIVEIRSVPHGEAPLWVRERWVGLRLPSVLQDDALVSTHTFGVLSGPHGRIRQLWALLRGRAKRESGYPVPVLRALAALEASSPEAATWWRENARHLMHPKAVFLFEATCGHVIEHAPWRVAQTDAASLCAVAETKNAPMPTVRQSPPKLLLGSLLLLLGAGSTGYSPVGCGCIDFNELVASQLGVARAADLEDPALVREALFKRYEARRVMPADMEQRFCARRDNVFSCRYWLWRKPGFIKSLDVTVWVGRNDVFRSASVTYSELPTSPPDGS